MARQSSLREFTRDHRRVAPGRVCRVETPAQRAANILATQLAPEYFPKISQIVNSTTRELILVKLAYKIYAEDPCLFADADFRNNAMGPCWDAFLRELKRIASAHGPWGQDRGEY